jgi:hypothetical protein
MDAFLRDQMYHIKARSENPKLRDAKDPLRRECDLDGPYLMEIYKQQDGRCAITGLELVTEFGNMCAASIDRIDSSKGHVKGNIQIVCAAVNLAKKHHPNEKIKEFFDDYYYHRMTMETRKEITENLDKVTSLDGDVSGLEKAKELINEKLIQGD